MSQMKSFKKYPNNYFRVIRALPVAVFLYQDFKCIYDNPVAEKLT